MCGICFIRKGINIKQHLFKFHFFEDYVSAEHLGADRSWAQLPLNQHVIKGNLVLKDIDTREVERIRPRGPDSFESLILTEKGVIEVLAQTASVNLKDGCSFCCQSVLRLRGEQQESKKERKGVLLYNGEIYLGRDALSPRPYESDTEWLYDWLEAIPDDKLSDPGCLLATLRQIRGDFAFVYQRDDIIYIAKDEFGKKSLLLGFQENGFVISSLPLGQFGKHEVAEQPEGDDEEGGKDWIAKYKAEYTAASNKAYYELPKNSLIQVRLDQHSAVWTRLPIYENWFIRSALTNKSEKSFQQNVEELTAVLLNSITELVSNIGAYERHFHEKEFAYEQKVAFQGELTNCHVAVLFSGGLDSCLIAKLLDLVLPKSASIDLVNLVFAADAPDRKTALEAIKELRGLSPRRYNLILMNKTLEDIEAGSEQHLQRIYPKDTHMDFNISAVLHSACQLRGISDVDGSPVTSRAKVILSGLGADEIFCGYSRYRVAFNRGGYVELERQMNFDLERLWLRNLGRDDRATSDRSKEVRYPFLYSPLVRYIKTEVPFESLTDFTRPKGSGDKVVLRKIAEKLGLEHTSGFKKTAIQFGTRLAKQSNVKNFGSNRKGKGTSVYQRPS